MKTYEEKMAELDRLSEKQRDAEQSLLTRLQHYLIGKKLDGNIPDDVRKLIGEYNNYVQVRKEVSAAITDLDLPQDDGGNLNVVVRSARDGNAPPKAGVN